MGASVHWSGDFGWCRRRGGGMTVVMVERIRLAIDTDEVVRRAARLRSVKRGGGVTLSDIVNEILREALAEEIAELEQASGETTEPRKSKRPGRPRKRGE